MFYPCAHHVRPRFPHHIFVLAASKQNDGLIKGGQCCQRPLWRGGDGIVDIFHTIDRRHMLQPMFHAREMSNRCHHHFCGNADAIGKGDGR